MSCRFLSKRGTPQYHIHSCHPIDLGIMERLLFCLAERNFSWKREYKTPLNRSNIGSRHSYYRNLLGRNSLYYWTDRKCQIPPSFWCPDRLCHIMALHCEASKRHCWYQKRIGREVEKIIEISFS